MTRKAPASKPPKFSAGDPIALDVNAQNADKLSRIKAQNAECRRLMLAWGAAKEEAKEARDAYQDATDVLHNMISETPQGDLFAQASREMDGDE